MDKMALICFPWEGMRLSQLWRERNAECMEFHKFFVIGIVLDHLNSKYNQVSKGLQDWSLKDLELGSQCKAVLCH